MDGLVNTYDDGLCDRKWTSPSSFAGTSINWPAFTNASTTYPALAVDMTPTANDGKSVGYGRFTGAAAITGLSAQPRYLIEGYRNNANTYYRITVRAQGANANTVVWLQAVYKQ
jgi:Tfp pilus assembly protein PilX